MTDRELLKLAAKAVGYTLEDHYDVNDLYWPWCVELGDNWCPLTDDGDALRLTVMLEIDVLHTNVYSAQQIHAFVGNNEQVVEDRGNDPYAATRRAIVSAAAEIGRTMT